VLNVWARGGSQQASVNWMAGTGTDFKFEISGEGFNGPSPFAPRVFSGVQVVGLTYEHYTNGGVRKAKEF